MAWVAGVDGCRAGWFRVCRHRATGELRFDLLSGVAELVRAAPQPEIVGLDIPIGLPDGGARACDVAARRCLGERARSVFPAPVRAAVSAASHEEASDITERIDGRRVSAQAWGLFPKIRAVDLGLASHADLRAAIREVHPELSFCTWNGGQPMSWAKKKPQGRAERTRLAEQWLGAGVVARARGGHLRQALQDDDILDAIAALWTAHRIADGSARTWPEAPPRDSTGLPMQIVY